MPQRLFDEIKNWAAGINTSAASDATPNGASPRGRNTYLRNIGDQTALIGKRRGAGMLNTTPVTGSPRLWGFQFKKASGSKYNLLVSDTGRLDKLNSDNSLTVVDATAFTTGNHPPTFAVANDLCFIVNDVDQKKFNGTVVQKFGITRPAAPTAAAAAGGAMATGIWDVALTYYNSATNHESSLSDFTPVTLSGGNLKINVSWSAPSDSQVTHVRVYVRQQSAGANAYLVVAGATPAPAATYFGYVPATTATVLDISAVQYAAFITLAPTTTENDVPLAGLKFPCWHASRIFLADTGSLYYSKVKNNQPYPEAFDPNNVQPVNPQDGDAIVGMHSFEGVLYVFKRFSMWKLVGTDPNSWEVELVSNSFGAGSMQSIVDADGAMYWWANSNQGLIAFNGTGSPVALGLAMLANTVAADSLDLLSMNIVYGAVDEANSTVLMAVPEFGATRNTLVIPFNYRLKRFQAEWWNPFDVNSMWTVEASPDTRLIYFGGYSGLAFQWWAAGLDGLPAGCTANGSVTSATSTTLTASAAAFTTTGGKLIDRYVYAVSSNGRTVQRRRITNNTATVLTVASAWDAIPNASYTYVIGAIDFQIDTPWAWSPSAFIKKRFEFLFVEATTSDLSVPLYIDLFVSKIDNDPRRSLTMTLGGYGGLYDASTSIYDTTKFAVSANTFGKLRCGCTGFAWKARVRNLQPNQDITLSKIAMQSVPMSIKR